MLKIFSLLLSPLDQNIKSILGLLIQFNIEIQLYISVTNPKRSYRKANLRDLPTTCDKFVVNVDDSYVINFFNRWCDNFLVKGVPFHVWLIEVVQYVLTF